MTASRAARLGARLLDALGRRCHACGAAARPGGGALPPLCAVCEAELTLRTGGYCPRCGAVAADPNAPPTLCGRCRREPPAWVSLAFYTVYGGLARRLLTDYKFHGRLGLGRLMQAMAVAAWERGGALPVPDLLAPVPLHPRRLSWRGFNQSLELGRLLARRLDRRIEPGALVRLRHTVPQSTLAAGRRRDNVRGAFEADPALVRGARVLLVDDIMTTGGTLEECARSLKRAGAAGVDVLVLARTAQDG